MPYGVLPLFLLMTALAAGQSESRKTFEVASIKPSAPLAGDFANGLAQLSAAGVKADPAIASFGRVSLTDLVARAYHVEGFQVSDPGWMPSAHFDIVAKLPAGEPVDSIPEMLQNLLIDRFGLKVHSGTKEFQVYTLNVGSDGLKLPLMTEEHSGDVAGGSIPQSMDQCARVLSSAMGRPVLNQTGKQGTYMLPKQLLQALSLRTVSQHVGATPEQEAGMSIPSESEVLRSLNTAGLLVAPRKLSLTEIVVDHVEKMPTEN